MNDGLTVLSSFRDPDGRVFGWKDRIIRVVDSRGRTALEVSSLSSELEAFMAAGSFVRCKELHIDEIAGVPQFAVARDFLLGGTGRSLIESEAIPFPSYPYEWPAEMLYASACLTLDLCEALLPGGIGLKDATPFNVLFRGAHPVFVDILSVEKRRSDDPVWLPYAQFVRTFVLPLLAAHRWGVPLSEIFFQHRDGLGPADLYKRCRALEILHPAVLGLIAIPTWLESSKSRGDTSLYRERKSSSSEQAEFVLRQTFRRLRRRLESLKPVQRRSAWLQYAADNSYSGGEAEQKEAFVAEVLKNFQPKWVLDIGCNSGAFSMLAARHGADVVAIDSDQASVGAVFKAASEQGLSILPLVVDIARPTPAVGWNNSEHASFLSRALGVFDAVLMLALLHHLLVTERIPLPLILELAAKLTKDVLVIEYVGQQDAMFKQLVRGRQELHADFTRESFEQACKRFFQIVDSKQVQADRRLYLLRKVQ